MLKSQATCDFDWQQLNQLAGEAADFEAELLAIFLQDAESSVGEIENAIAVKDILAIEEAAHSLRGASANVGAKALAAVAGQLEQVARSGKMTGARTLLKQLTRHCRNVQTQFQANR